MRRLRAIAAIVALAVIWLGYSVVHEMASERAGQPVVELQTASGTSTSIGGANTQAQAPAHSTPAALGPQIQTAAGAGDLQQESAITEPAAVEAADLAIAPVDLLPSSNAHEPFFQSALNSTQAGAGSGALGRRGASGGGMSSMGGGGGAAGGGASAGSPAATDDTAGTGDGKPTVLGHRFLADSGESNAGTGSDGNGSNGANGSSGGSNDHNGDANGNNGSNGSNGSNDQNGDGNGNNGKNAENGSNGGNGSSGDNGSNGASGNGGSDQGNGGDQGGAREGGVNTLAASLVDETTTSTTTGGGDVRDVPEPGSILVGLGAVAALIRRRTR